MAVQPAIMSGFYRVPPGVADLARDVANLNACIADMGCGSSPVAHQFKAAMPAQAAAVAASSQVLASSKKRAKSGKSGKSATPQVMVACRYGTRCTSLGCAFQHPKGFLPVCTMGPACLGPKVCPYRHKNVPKQPPKAQPKVQPKAKAPKVPKAQPKAPPKQSPKQSPKQKQPVPCRFADACHRPDCYFSHPGGDHRSGLMCKHGASCRGKNGMCTFNHP